MKMRHYLMEERYGQGRNVDGLIPAVRGPDYNVLVVSLGADKQRCTEISADVCNHLNGVEAASAMLATLKAMLEVYSDTPISAWHHAINAAIAQAEAAGIKAS